MFENWQSEISAAYGRLYDDEFQTHQWRSEWQLLADDCVDRAAGVRLLMNVRETDDPEPYETASQMLADIAGGHFVVSRANSDHPLWRPEENVAFRITHDVLGHYAASVAKGWPNNDPESSRATVAGFDWEGECAACDAHFKLLHGRADARMALFTECLGQTAWAIDNGFDKLVPKVGELGTYFANAAVKRAWGERVYAEK